MPPLQIVLDNAYQRALVLYDERSRQVELIHDEEQYLQLRSSTPQRSQSPFPVSSREGQLILGKPKNRSVSPPRRHSETFCVTCGSKLPSGFRHRPSATANDFVDRNYFQLLAGDLQESSLGSNSTSTTGRAKNGTFSNPVYNSISENAFLQGYFDKFFELKHELGRGGRGTVWLVEHVLNGVSLGLFACKKVPVGDDTVWLTRALYEVTLLKQLNHPNLIRYNHVWLETSQWSPFGPPVPCAFILQEYCSGGNLEAYVKKRRALTPFEVVSFMKDILSGVSYLHEHQIIHRDLKPSNFLLKDEGNGPGTPPQILVSDFGEGNVEGQHRASTGTTGTLEYCAPELLSRDIRGNLGEFSRHSDMFSVGLVLYFLCFGHTPYRSPRGLDSGAVNFESLREEICTFPGYEDGEEQPNFPIPTELQTLLTSWLSTVPEERVSAKDALFVLENMDMSTMTVDTSLSTRRLSIKPLIMDSEDEEEEEVGGEFFGELPAQIEGLRGAEKQRKAQENRIIKYALKGVLLATKIATIQREKDMSPILRQLLILLIGAELPLNAQMSVIMFAAHMALLLVGYYGFL
ncbi:putative serine/threonine-protein kinase iksA [Yarrowia sp. B02]|nr:putative serine/threonine-protein kinase iksA [Yarrowia sp. B02]